MPRGSGRSPIAQYRVPGRGPSPHTPPQQPGHEDDVGTLISSGADISRRDVNGWTALMHASIENHMALAVVRLLLEHMEGRRLDDGNCHGRTAFWWACSNGHIEIARLLLLAGADHSVADYDGTTPREEAEAEGRHHCVELIQASTACAVFSVRK